MPTAVGPFSLSTRLNCAAITSNALSHETGSNSPSFAYWPFFMRSKGVSNRSSPYMIFDRKYPFTQFNPRLTSASGSPCVATTRLSLTATVTPQPVPQKRHGAFDHLSPAPAASPATVCAAPGTGMPATAPAVAAAVCRRKSLLLMDIGDLLIHGF